DFTTRRSRARTFCCFNGAVARWRRRLMVPSGTDAALIKASMEPSLVGDGDLRGQDLGVPDSTRFNGAVARWRRRPSTATRSGLSLQVWLQWSRRSLATETLTNSELIAGRCKIMLQWSRRSLATETSACASSAPTRAARFNGAVARWRRRHDAVAS